MVVSSRTPEGLPHRCPVCGAVTPLESSFPGGDATCPTCGHLLWRFHDHLLWWICNYFSQDLGVNPAQIRPDTLLWEFGPDSLGVVELVMKVEEDFGIRLPESEMEQVRNVEDLIDVIERSWRDRAA
jgi:acyl carrier protein